MPQFSVRVEGLDKLRVGFNKFITTLPVITKAWLKRVMALAMKRSVPYKGGNSYAIPERGYERTGNLGSSTYLMESGQTYTIKSEAVRKGHAYSVFVIGNSAGEGQASVHYGFWTPMRSAVDLELEAALPEGDRVLQKGIEAAGL